MVKLIYTSILLVLLVNGVGYSDPEGDRSETLERTNNTNAETVQAEIRRGCDCRVTIEPDENRWQFLLTFHFEPYDNDIDPVFYMNERIAAGVGLKVRKVFPYDEAEITVCKQDPDDKRGKLIKISSFQHPDLSRDGYDFFNGRDGRKLVFQQRVLPQDRFSSEEGLYAVTYEHPWAGLEGTNVRFFSNTLLVSVTSSERRDALYSLFKDNPELELASYQMKHPMYSEFAQYSRPLRSFDTYIQIGMPYDEVLFLMGSPDYSGRDGLHWGYETSPVGGFYIRFENGKVSAKGFSFESS